MGMAYKYLWLQAPESGLEEAKLNPTLDELRPDHCGKQEG